MQSRDQQHLGEFKPKKAIYFHVERMRVGHDVCVCVLFAVCTRDLE